MKMFFSLQNNITKLNMKKFEYRLQRLHLYGFYRVWWAQLFYLAADKKCYSKKCAEWNITTVSRFLRQKWANEDVKIV